MAARKWFALLAVVWFVLGFLIWQYGQGWVRHYGGDVLVVGFLLWTLLAIRPSLNIYAAAGGVLMLALLIEVSQLFNLSELRSTLGETGSSLILGHTFDWVDVLSYVGGLVLCVPLAKWITGR